MHIFNSIPIFFKKNESVDFHSLEMYLEKCVEDNIEFAYLMTYNSRVMQLDDSELVEITKFISNTIKQTNIKLIISHPFLATNKSLENYFKHFEDISSDIFAVSMLYPERYYGDDQFILDFLKIPADYGLKTLIHEQKLISGYNGELINWPHSLIKKAIQDESCIGIKEDSKDDNVTVEIIDSFGNEKFIVVAGGGKRRTIELHKKVKQRMCWLNGSSIISPKLGSKFLQSLEQGDSFHESYIADFEIPFFDIVAKYGWHLTHKAMLNYFLGTSPYERSPLPVLPQSILMQEHSNLAKIKNFLERNQ